MSGWKICSKLFRKFCPQKEKTKLFRDSVLISNRISFKVSCHCYENGRVLCYKIDKRWWEPRNCRQIFLHLSLLLKGQILFVIQFDRPTISFKWLLSHQLIQLNLFSLSSNLVSSRFLYQIKLFGMKYHKYIFTSSNKINYYNKNYTKKSKHIKFIYF